MSHKQRSKPSADKKPRDAMGGGAVARLMADAERLMSEGRALLAKPLLDDALAQAPASAGVRRLLAVRALMLKSNDEAIEHAQTACSLDAASGDLRMVLGRAYKAAGRMDDALEAYRAAVNLDPGLAEAHVSLGIALKLRGQLSDAIACYRQALAINPQLAAAHANLGNALLLQAEQLGLAAEDEVSSTDPAADEARHPTRAHVSEPWRYGFHATLKAPLRLAPGCSEAGLRDAVAQLAQRTARFVMPALSVQWLDNFLALQPQAPLAATHPLHRLADACVTELDAWRAEPSPDELQRRLATPLSAEQRALLQRHGYPHVLGHWRFHMTLSNSLPPDASVRDELQQARGLFLARR